MGLFLKSLANQLRRAKFMARKLFDAQLCVYVWWGRNCSLSSRSLPQHASRDGDSKTATGPVLRNIHALISLKTVCPQGTASRELWPLQYRNPTELTAVAFGFEWKSHVRLDKPRFINVDFCSLLIALMHYKCHEYIHWMFKWVLSHGNCAKHWRVFDAIS